MRKLLLAFTPFFAVLLLYQFQPFFMDEAFLVKNIVGFAGGATIIPPEVNYPTLYVYLSSPFVALGVVARCAFQAADSLKDCAVFLKSVRPAEFAAGARLFSFVMLVFIVVGWGAFLGRKLSPWAAFIAMALLLCAEPFVAYAGYALPDIAMVAFTLATMLALIWSREAAGGTVQLRGILLASLFAGFAMSAKYNGAAAAGVVALSIFELGVQRRSVWTVAKFGALAALVFVSAVLLGSPAWVIVPGNMLEGMTLELQRAAFGHLGSAGVPLLGQLELLFMSTPLLFVSALAGLAMVHLRDPTDRLVGYLFVASLVLPTFNQKQFIQYVFPAYLALCYFSARFMNWLTAWRGARVAVTCCAVAAFCYANAGAFNYLRQSTVALAQEWIFANVGSSDKIAMDWAYVPDIMSRKDIDAAAASKSYANSRLLREHLDRDVRAFVKADVEYSPAWLESTPARYFVTSNLAFDRFFHHGLFTRLTPAPDTGLGREFRQRKEFYAEAFHSPRWQLVRQISSNDGNVIYIFRNKEAGGAGG